MDLSKALLQNWSAELLKPCRPVFHASSTRLRCSFSGAVVTTVTGFFMEDVLVTYQEAADVRRCARQPDGGWHRLPGIEMLMVVLRLLSVRASQVCYLAAVFCTPNTVDPTYDRALSVELRSRSRCCAVARPCASKPCRALIGSC